MDTTTNSHIKRNSVFIRIAVAACVLLLIPFGAMQFTTAVDWSIGDFVVMGVLILAVGSLFVFAARKVSPRHRLLVGILVAVLFLYVWLDLAVGVFSNLGK